MASITRAYFSKGLLNCEGSGLEAVGVMDVLTLTAGRALEIKVTSERAVFGAEKRAAGAGPGDWLLSVRLGCPSGEREVGVQ